MSISVETANAHKNDPAVLCCRAEEGTIIEVHNLEDPAIFDDLVDSNLLNLDGALTIGQVLGAKLLKTCDSLTPLTAAVLEGFKENVEEEAPVEEEVKTVSETPVMDAQIPMTQFNGGVLKIHIGEGKDIDIELPLIGAGFPRPGGVNAPLPTIAAAAAPSVPEIRNVTKGSFERKHFQITEVKRGPETKIEGTTLYIREGIEKDAVASQDLVLDLKIDIITPDRYNEYSETIMDVQPIAVKESGEIGSGVTRVIDGVIIMVTGTDELGVQIGEFGSSEGILEENIMWNRPGAPDKGEIFIKTNVTIKAHTNMERPGPLAAHSATDLITQEIRDALKGLDESLITNTEHFEHVRHYGKKKVVIVKEIMGQGAMHDNIILPQEPVGIIGGKPNVDLGNVPVTVSPLEVMDGCIHALTCIGPASKETSRHYWREPLVLECLNDEEIDLAGVVFVGSPQINSEKFYVSKRVGMTLEAMDAEGAFVTTEGFGNNHIDFASHIEQIGMRGISVVGMTFSAVQGALVVGNKYMTHMVDNNKSEAGIENEVLSCNTLCKEDAVRALAMLKSAMAGEAVKAAEKKWNPNVKASNVEAVEETNGEKLELVLNEQSLPMSQKRKEKYN